MKKPLIIANWKANPASSQDAILLAKRIESGISKLRNVKVVVAPPYLFLLPISRFLKILKLGAQNVFWEDIGPFTGEVSWRQLKTIGVGYVIVGHSERKIYLKETDEMIRKKVNALFEHGLVPVLCVGENKREGSDIPEIVGIQLKNALRGLKKKYIEHLVVAYEPLWAISTVPGAHPVKADDVFRAGLYIRRILTGLFGEDAASKVQIIYGGSVRKDNVGAFLNEGKMVGALVGGASLNPDEFVELVREVSRVRV